MQPSTLLYISHTISAWNSRAFQFGSVLFLASLFPGTLLPVSVYALSSKLPGALFAHRFGHYIDNNERLRVVRNSIVGQRASVILACAIYVSSLSKNFPYFSLTLISMLGANENSWSIINSVSVERDWVVVVAGSDVEKLNTINGTMRFIDLSCKLLGPFFIGIIDGVFGSHVTAVTMLAMSTICCTAEYFAIARVYYAVPALAHKTFANELDTEIGPEEQVFDREFSVGAEEIELGDSVPQHSDSERAAFMQPEEKPFSFWRHPLMPVSIADTFLYIQVLTFNGQMISFLLSTGMHVGTMTVLRTASTIFELATTLAAPAVIRKFGAYRAAAWYADFQVAALLPTCILFIYLGEVTVSAAIVLSIGTIISRLGLWGFELCAQIIIQDGIKETERGKYSTVEKATQNWAGILTFGSTVVFSKPEQFVYPALMSVSSVGICVIIYNFFYYYKLRHNA